jgi:hypothetical protein
VWFKIVGDCFCVDLIVVKCEYRSFSVRKNLAIGFRDEDCIIESFVIGRFIIVICSIGVRRNGRKCVHHFFIVFIGCVPAVTFLVKNGDCLTRWLFRRAAACTTYRVVGGVIGHRKAINRVSLLALSALQIASSFDFVDGIVESSNFFVLQRAITTLGHICQLQWPDRDATQHNHFVSESREYATDFTVLSFA